MTLEVVDIAVVFGQLSLVSVGGIQTVLPELQRLVVEQRGWMTAQQFAALFAIAQAAPGPNMLVSTLIGWRVGGPAGAAAATLALIVPSGLLAYAVGHAWQRFRDRPWRKAIEAALLPVTAGMVVAAAIVLCLATAGSAGHVALTLTGAGLLFATRLHPLWLLALGALLGAADLL